MWSYGWGQGVVLDGRDWFIHALASREKFVNGKGFKNNRLLEIQSPNLGGNGKYEG